MGEFDQLVASPGVLMAGRIGPDGRFAEHKTKGLYFENPAATGMVERAKVKSVDEIGRLLNAQRP